MSTQKVLYINDDLHHKLKVAAADNKMTLTAFVEMVLSDYNRERDQKQAGMQCRCEAKP